MLEDVRSLTVALTGEFDMSRTAELRDTILAGLTDVDHVIVDLEAVTFLDSSGLRALIEVHGVLDDHGAVLTLVNPRSHVRLLLSITNTAELFGLASS
jgi:anti-sigma B factor antagonist